MLGLGARQRKQGNHPSRSDITTNIFGQTSAQIKVLSSTKYKIILVHSQSARTLGVR